MVELETFSLSLEEEFEIFWDYYPKKVWKRPCFLKFKKIHDKKNLFLWLKLYIEKWKIEETPKQFIPNPLTFLNQERYYDEIIIDESKKKKYKIIIEAKKIEKEEKKKELEANHKRQQLIDYYNNLSIEEQTEIKNIADDKIQMENPILWQKKWAYYEQYKKIIIRSILNSKLEDYV